MVESSAPMPAGSCIVTVRNAWLPSGRAMFTLNGVDAPAVKSALCALNAGANGSWPTGQGPPPGPSLIENAAFEAIVSVIAPEGVSVPDHGANSAWLW